MMMPPPLPQELLDSLPEAARLYIRQIEAIAAHILHRQDVLSSQLVELELKSRQDSTNSSKPPSSDGPGIKRGVPRPPSSRRRGGQKGHPRRERL